MCPIVFKPLSGSSIKAQRPVSARTDLLTLSSGTKLCISRSSDFGAGAILALPPSQTGDDAKVKVGQIVNSSMPLRSPAAGSLKLLQWLQHA
eukprot:scaffold89054_cov84-Phaeocystis_antarctica.AAC.2